MKGYECSTTSVLLYCPALSPATLTDIRYHFCPLVLILMSSIDILHMHSVVNVATADVPAFQHQHPNKHIYQKIFNEQKTIRPCIKKHLEDVQK